MNWKRIFVALLATLVLLPNISMAQSIITGAIAGNVNDPSGAVIAGATVSLKNAATGGVVSTVTGSTGSFQFTLVKPATYTLSVSQQGFKQSTQSVEILLGQTITVNVRMQLGSGSITVEVTGQPAALQTEDANISTNFDTQQIANLPNPGGDITYVAQTAPGILMNNSTLGGYGNFSAFGLPGTANLFTINGNDYNDPFLNLNNSGSSNLLLGGNEMQEVAVVSNGYTGQYGRQAGAQIDYSTMSGANHFHGDAVYNWTGRALNANDPIQKLFGASRPFENNNQWAARFGGPILKDKAFFFVNYEGIRYIFGSNATVNLPSPDFQAFVLGNIPQDSATQAFYNNIFSLYNAAPGAANAAPVQNSCGDLGSFLLAARRPGGLHPFQGGSSSGGETDCFSSYGTSSSNGNKEWLLSGRVDYTFNEANKIFGRFKLDRGVQPTYTDPINSAFNNQSIQPQKDAQLNYTHLFSPTVVNNFVGSILYYSALFGSQQTQKALGLFPGNLVFVDPDQTAGQITALGTGSGSPNGFQAGFLFPQGRNVTQWQLVDDLSVQRGNHGFKMGVNFRRDDVSDHTASELTQYPILQVNMAGFANDEIFDGNGGGVSANYAISPVQPIALYSMGVYFQDEYRVSPRLKLTLTLRADRNSSGVCQHDCVSLPVTPFTDMPHGADIPYNAAFGGSFQNGQHSILPNVEKVVLEPRLGFAWTPIGDKTVIRGGVGLFTDLYPGAILDAYTTNFPQVVPWSVSAPGTTLAFDSLPASSSAFPNSGPLFVTGCDAAFTTNFLNGGNLPTYAAAAPQCTTATGNVAVPNLADLQNKIENPKYLEWNLEVQRSLNSSIVFSVNYVGNRGYDEIMINRLVNAFCDSVCTEDGLTNTGLPATAVDPRVGSVAFLSNPGYSNYNGVTFSLQDNGWHGLSGRLNYSYSHALDTSSNGGTEPFSVITSVLGQINPYNMKSNYGASDYDARQILTASYVYQIPLKSQNRFVNGAIGGWMISNTFFWHSGFPFSVIDGLVDGLGPTNNLAGTAILMQPEFSQRNFSNGQQCAAALAVAFGIAASGPAPCFGPGSANLFAPETSFTGSVVGRNSFRGPGFFGGDLSVHKTFVVREGLNFMVGASAYNVFNHANYGAPIANNAFGLPYGVTYFMSTPPTSPYGAFASAATDMRMVQVVGKFTF